MAGSRVAVLVLVAAATLPIAGCGRPPRPNILLIVVDTARADRFTTNGYARDTTPAIAALGRDGAVYLNAYASSPWTLPSHASLFTGLYPSSHGADSGHLRLDEHLPFLARRLKAAGYSTVACVANPWVGKDYNFHLGFDVFDEIWRGVGEASEDAGAAIVSDRLERWLAWRAENDGARSKPFFLFINYFEPHLPYDPPEPERTRFLGDGTSNPVGAEATADPAVVARLRRFGPRDIVRQFLGAGTLTPGEFRTMSDLYDGEIAYVDRRIGEVVEGFRRRGLLDETVVVVTSDHGEMLGEHGLVDHRLTLYEPVLRIPLIVRYPGAIRAGQRLDSPVLLQDLYPTLLWLAGMRDQEVAVRPGGAEQQAEARPLPGIRGLESPSPRGRSPSDPVIAEYALPREFLVVMRVTMTGTDTTPWERTQVAFRAGDDKLIWGSDGRHQLFNLASDPAEAADRAALDGLQVAGLAGRVEAWLQRPGARPPLAISLQGSASGR